MNRTITVTDVEPAMLSIRHPLGIDLDLRLTMKKQDGSPIDPTLSQIVLMPRSLGGFLPFDMDPYDVPNGVASVMVPGSALTDVLGYGIELYRRKPNPISMNPPVPIQLAATGTLVTQGSAYQKSSLSETVLPTVMGPPGPPGPAGDAGDQGQRGSIWTTGAGAPTPTGSEITGDMYLDEATGDVYRYANGMWTRGTF